MNGQRYLNREQKLDAIMIAAFMTWIQDKTEKWSQIKSFDKQVIGHAKRSHGFIKRVLDYHMTGLDPIAIFWI